MRHETPTTPTTPTMPTMQDPVAEALWQYLARLEDGIGQIESRIDRLYLAVGGGTLLLAAIGLAAGFIARGGP